MIQNHLRPFLLFKIKEYLIFYCFQYNYKYSYIKEIVKRNLETKEIICKNIKEDREIV